MDLKGDRRVNASNVWDDQFDTVAAAKAEFCGASPRRTWSAPYPGSPFQSIDAIRIRAPQISLRFKWLGLNALEVPCLGSNPDCTAR